MLSSSGESDISQLIPIVNRTEVWRVNWISSTFQNIGDHLVRPVYHPSLAIQLVLNVYQSPLSIQPNSRCLSSFEPIAGKGSKCVSSFRPVPTRLKCARRVSPGSTPCHTSVYRHDKSRSHHRPPFHIEQNPSTLRYYTLFHSERNPPLLPSYTLSRTSCVPPVFSSGLFVENNCPAPTLVVPP